MFISTHAAFANEVHGQSPADNADGALTYSPYDLDAVVFIETSEPDYSGMGRRDLRSRVFWDDSLRARLLRRLPTSSTYKAQNARVQVVPMDKRTLPIDLQKAFFAHGIIGRRR